jgi:hypothetical protein
VGGGQRLGQGDDQLGVDQLLARLAGGMPASSR